MYSVLGGIVWEGMGTRNFILISMLMEDSAWYTLVLEHAPTLTCTHMHADTHTHTHTRIGTCNAKVTVYLMEFSSEKYAKFATIP